MRNFHFFGPVLTGLYLAVNFYVARWTLRFFKPGRRAAAGGALGHALLWFGFFWLGASFILFYTLLPASLVFGRLKARGVTVPVRPYALALAAALIGIAVRGGADRPRVKLVEADIAGLPEKLDGFRIAQISDLHLGRLNGEDKLRRLADEINSLRPDLVVLTGDFFERRENVPGEVCGILKGLRARHGTAAALGNHDLFAGKDKAADFLGGCGPASKTQVV
jgi:hypothetical protein